MLPNNSREKDRWVTENYLRTSTFCGSSCDGFMQEYMMLNPRRLVSLPDWVSKEVASFTEMVSVALHAIMRFEKLSISRRNVIGIWGDGNIGFIVALLIRILMPSIKIILIGRNVSKMNNFTFVDEVYLSGAGDNLPDVDHAFECCGGDGAAAAIDQIIDRTRPEGTIMLLGVSETAVAIKTRMILEKGLHLIGSSRSDRMAFDLAIRLYESHPEMVSYLSSLVGDVISINGIIDAKRAFEADLHKNMGKTILLWNI